jgi:hypothetical protein
MGFIIKKTAATDIVKAKVTLTSANLLTPNYIVSIPEYTGVTGYYWNVLYMWGIIRPINIPPILYLGTSQIHIQAIGSTNFQYKFINTFMQNIVGTSIAATINTITGQVYRIDRGLEIHNPGILTLGDTELDIYIGANLIQA